MRVLFIAMVLLFASTSRASDHPQPACTGLCELSWSNHQRSLENSKIRCYILHAGCSLSVQSADQPPGREDLEAIARCLTEIDRLESAGDVVPEASAETDYRFSCFIAMLLILAALLVVLIHPLP